MVTPVSSPRGLPVETRPADTIPDLGTPPSCTPDSPPDTMLQSDRPTRGRLHGQHHPRASGRSWTKTLLWVIGIACRRVRPHPVRAVRAQPATPIRQATNPSSGRIPQAAGDRQDRLLRLPQQQDRVVVGDEHRSDVVAAYSTTWTTRARTSTSRSGPGSVDGAPVLPRRSSAENMPPLQYTLLHPNAKLSDAQKQTLIRRLPSSIAANGGGRPPAVRRRRLRTAGTADATAIVDDRCGNCHQAP